MTLPYERTNAVNWTREFLYDLLDPKKTPRIPRELRRRAGSLLKHYPTEFDMDRASGALTTGLIPTEPVFSKDTLGQILKDRLSPGAGPVVSPNELSKDRLSPGGCPVCGLGSKGEVTGYVCNHPKCPIRISC
jgi:hypothetical protein